MQLEAVIVEQIRKNGPVSFRDYMEMCLYYPELGYYTRPGNRIGSSGDYYTSPHLTAAYGTMIGKQIREMYEFLGYEPFTIVEYGAGAGLLCQDILQFLKENKTLYSRIRYCIIEKSPSMREKQRKLLRDTDKISWYDSIQELIQDQGPVKGCIIANELVDNLSVHQVIMEKELMEVFVDYQQQFTELFRPASPELRNYLEELRVELPEKYRTEISLDAVRWIQDAAAALQSGWIITIDYGYTAQEYYGKSRNRGTLVCYNHHTINDNPYDAVGRQDITTHVNFSALHHWGSLAGLSLCGLTNQANFLLELGLEEYFAGNGSRKNAQDRKQDAMLRHVLLIDMGSRFRVLIQQKNVPECLLSGLRSSRSLLLQPSIDPMFI